jgi:hypothetical protein
MASDNIQGTDYLNYNFGDKAGNGNYQTYTYDWNSGNGQWKGSACLTENTDATLTFWQFDSNWFDDVWSEAFQFTFDVTGGTLDTSVTQSSNVGLVTFVGGNQGDWTVGSYCRWNGSTPLKPARFDQVVINGVKCVRVLLTPVAYGSSTAGMTVNLTSVHHYENGKHQNYDDYDGTGNGGILTLRGLPLPPPPVPTLVSLNPAAADRGQTTTVTCTNLTADYRFYINDVSHPCLLSSGITTTSAQVIVPNNATLGAGTIFASNGIHQTNSLAFTVTGNVLSSGYSNEDSQNFPKPVTLPPPPKLIQVSVTPSTATVTEGQDITFTAIGTWDTGSTRQLTSADGLVWSVLNSNGTGTIDPTSGHFVAQIAGSDISVIATVSPLSGRATVTIAQRPVPPSKLESLAITPLNPVIQIGQQVQFHSSGIAKVYSDVQGQIVSNDQTVYPPVTWAVQAITGKGTINQYGLFTATDIRNYLDLKIWNGISGNYLPSSGNGDLASAPSVTTTIPTVDLSSANLPAGANSTFIYTRLVGYLCPSISGVYTVGINSADGANLYINGNLIFSALLHQQSAGGNLTYTNSGQLALQAGQKYPLVIEWGCSGTYSPRLQLLWTPPGQSTQVVPTQALEADAGGGATVNVVATAQDGSGISTQSTVTIKAVPPPPPPSSTIVSLSVKPKSATIAAGSTQQFTATGYDQYGEPHIVPVVWSITNTAGAGVISTTGLVTGQIAGSQITVTAKTTDGLFQDNAAVVVVAGPTTKLVVSPPSTTLKVPQGQQFTVAGYDSYGNSKALSGIIWSIIGGVGTTDQTGLFTSSTAGVGKILATYGSLQGTSTINVLQVVGGVTIDNAPQQPFARIHIRDTVQVPVILDTRSRGGGIESALTVKIGDDFWWDLAPFDGMPFQNYGSFAVNIQAVNSLGNSLDTNASKIAIEQVLAKYAAPHFLGVITPQSRVPETPY